MPVDVTCLSDNLFYYMFSDNVIFDFVPSKM